VRQGPLLVEVLAAQRGDTKHIIVEMACFWGNLAVTEKELLPGLCVPGVHKGDVLVVRRDGFGLA
jgi:hypothetical protein